MKSVEELQHDIDQFDFRLLRKTKVVKRVDGGLTITHMPMEIEKQQKELRRFRSFVETNWTVREIDFAASFHAAGTFLPHEDTEALVTRAKIKNTVDECFVEKREPTVVNYSGFGFASWAEAEAFDKTLKSIHREALMLLGACSALGLHMMDLRCVIVKNRIESNKDSENRNMYWNRLRGMATEEFGPLPELRIDPLG